MKLKKRLRLWIEENYGDKCESWEVGCPICDRWQAYEALFGEPDCTTVRQQIVELEEMIKWRMEFLAKTQH